MSEIEREALDGAFERWKMERGVTVSDDKAFELFAIEQILKDADLGDDEIASGNLGGGGDDGVDGFYFFIDRHLVQEDDFQPKAALLAELHLIQCTRSGSFTEDKIHRLTSF